MPTLSVPTRLALFGALLAVAFGAALGLGALVDPTDGAPKPADHGGMAAGHGTTGDAGHGDEASSGHGGEHAATAPGGLSATQDGYRLVADRTRFTAGDRTTFRFRIDGPDGRPVRSGYELESERELHLIVVRRDGRGFQHLHPRRAADGTWSVPLTVTSAGSHRVLADFVVGGVRRTLGLDVEAGGVYRPAAPATPSSVATVDGYRVALDANPPRAGTSTPLFFRVTRGGRPVRDLQPYLGARGHLVALREGDLAYLHVHPEEDAAPGDVPFAATFPSAGRYSLYLQFRVGGVVRTATFVTEVSR
ncbi:hypothetical protein [Patulibacter minatonensis]|uniref:hypothetical protein n=1 Tax=Patulibacter minatonensis TaxID=298163 RepID=UPI0005620766|nr:hypothetical protein [Patulibacter minatonensis]